MNSIKWDTLLSALENVGGVALLFMTVATIIKPYVLASYPLILFCYLTVLFFMDVALMFIGWMAHNTSLISGRDRSIQLWNKHALAHIAKNAMMNAALYVLIAVYWHYNGSDTPIFSLSGNDADAVKFQIFMHIKLAVVIVMAHNTAHGIVHIMNKEFSALLTKAAMGYSFRTEAMA